ncbi:MAG: PqqD family protein [Clostridia bacterium]|nr:PqqD family protein [Clostridia bacterium]
MNEKKLRFTGLLSRNKQGQVWVQDPFTGNYHEMDEVGYSICTLLKSGKTRSELVAALTEEYEVEAARCEKDITPFLEKLIDCGLVKEVQA